MLESLLPLHEFQGLRPKSWLCVGSGFSREDVKRLLLDQGISFVGEAVQTFQQLCQRVAGVDATRVLPSSGRQEVLRYLLTQPGLKDRFPELKRLRRQGTFLRRLDLAIQSGRMAFAHWEEAEVYAERLQLRLGENPVREEVQALARGYEAWLEQKALWDPPLVIRHALEQGFKALPERIYYLHGQTQESLELSFWEALSGKTQVVKIGPAELKATGKSPKFFWESWHTLDDAAERLADTLAEQARTSEKLSETVVLISDVPSSRRTLRRALTQKGIQLSDPRDPTRIRTDEIIKWAMLPLDVVARGFERTRVIPFLNEFTDSPQAERSIWTQEIQERGIRSGLESYGGGKLLPLYGQLKSLNSFLGGKKTAAELALAHLTLLDRHKTAENSWISGFFEQIWKQMLLDLERVDLSERRAAPLYWMERLQTRITEAAPPVERIKPVGGLDVYRLHQTPSRKFKKVFLLGIPALWFSGEGMGDYWFSEREREILGSEFSVRSAVQIRTERTLALQAWLGHAEEVVFLDSLHDPDGRERESILPVIEEIKKWDAGFEIKDEPLVRASHPRWLKSYGALRPVPPQKTKLEPSAGARPMISASALENYSRCGFLALARSRWKLEDLSEPDTDLWPHVKGVLLHEAVRLLVESRDESGGFSKTAEEVIDLAWTARRPKGLVRGARVEAYVKRKLAVLLRTFQEQERKFIQRAGTKPLALDNMELQEDYAGFAVRGKPDRIDEHPDGLWIIDYKTSSSAPNGAAMLENGYRLQLPFYALTAQKKFGKAALGFQFVQLDRKGTRTNGAYFERHNGKEPGKLTDTTKRSKSLLLIPREDAWARFEDEIQTLGAQLVSGIFEAKPRISPRSKECASCQVSDLCGFRRLIEDGDAEEGDGA